MFRFKLEVPLDVRKKKEDAALSIYVEAKRILAGAEAKLREFESAKHEAMVEYSRKGEEGQDIGVEELCLFENYFSRMRVQIWTQQEVIRQEEKNVNLELAKLLEATKRKKILEILRDKAFEAYRKDERDRDRRLMDEISVTRFARQQ